VVASRFHTSKVILVDSGNSTDFYQYVNIVLNNTIVTRPFTVYQLTDIVVNQLPQIIQQYDAKMVVVSDLLDMFVRDPQIGYNETAYLINQIINSITKSRALGDVLVIVSFSYAHDLFHHNNKPYLSYGRMILQRFNNCIEITDSKDKKNRAIDVTAVLSDAISLSNLSGLIAMRPPSRSSIILQCPNMALCSLLKLTGIILT
jgi:hypothetical protein